MIMDHLNDGDVPRQDMKSAAANSPRQAEITQASFARPEDWGNEPGRVIKWYCVGVHHVSGANIDEVRNRCHYAKQRVSPEPSTSFVATDSRILYRGASAERDMQPIEVRNSQGKLELMTVGIEVTKDTIVTLFTREGASAKLKDVIQGLKVRDPLSDDSLQKCFETMTYGNLRVLSTADRATLLFKLGETKSATGTKTLNPKIEIMMNDLCALVDAEVDETRYETRREEDSILYTSESSILNHIRDLKIHGLQKGRNAKDAAVILKKANSIHRLTIDQLRSTKQKTEQIAEQHRIIAQQCEKINGKDTTSVSLRGTITELTEESTKLKDDNADLRKKNWKLNSEITNCRAEMKLDRTITNETNDQNTELRKEVEKLKKENTKLKSQLSNLHSQSGNINAAAKQSMPIASNNTTQADTEDCRGRPLVAAQSSIGNSEANSGRKRPAASVPQDVKIEPKSPRLA